MEKARYTTSGIGDYLSQQEKLADLHINSASST